MTKTNDNNLVVFDLITYAETMQFKRPELTVIIHLLFIGRIKFRMCSKLVNSINDFSFYILGILI